MVRISVLGDALKTMYNAEKRGKRQILIRPSSRVVIKFLQVMMKKGKLTKVNDGCMFCDRLQHLRKAVTSNKSAAHAMQILLTVGLHGRILQSLDNPILYSHKGVGGAEPSQARVPCRIHRRVRVCGRPQGRKDCC